MKAMEIRVSDDSVEITGYVNAVGRSSDPLRDVDGFFTETIQPGAFGRALSENPNVPMLLNHDEQRVIARGEALELREDNVGLHVRATVTDPEVIAKARDSRLRGWSFGFIPTRQKVDDSAAPKHRDVYALDLLEVSLLDDTRQPAYPATSVYTRDGEPEVERRDFDDWWVDVKVDLHVNPDSPDVYAPNNLPEPIPMLDEPE